MVFIRLLRLDASLQPLCGNPSIATLVLAPGHLLWVSFSMPIPSKTVPQGDSLKFLGLNVPSVSC